MPSFRPSSLSGKQARSIDAVLREDRLGIDLVARAPKGIPKHDWSLDLGDALHNPRSAFDAVAWGMAHFKDAEPTRPKSVYFPICIDEKQWKKALNDWVGEIDPEFQERLRIMQPFTFMVCWDLAASMAVWATAADERVPCFFSQAWSRVWPVRRIPSGVRCLVSSNRAALERL